MQHKSVRARTGVLVAAVVATLVLAGCLTAEQRSVLDAMNADREANGLVALPTQEDAQKKAQAWAEKLAAEGTLYHSDLREGIEVRWCRLGENVGYASTVEGVQAGYMGSPGHRANILSTEWNGVGVGHAVGKVGRHEVVFTVQFFIKTC